MLANGQLSHISHEAFLTFSVDNLRQACSSMTEVLAPPIQHICGAVQTAGSQALHSVRHVRGQVKNGLQHASKVVEQVLSPLNVKVHGTLARISQPSLVRA